MIVKAMEDYRKYAYESLSITKHYDIRVMLDVGLVIWKREFK